MTGHIAKVLILIQSHIDALYRRICEHVGKITKINAWVLKNFIHVSIDLISASKSKISSPLGDIIFTKKCKKFANLSLNSKREINEQCFEEFPTKIGKNSKFLRLPDQRLIENPTRFKCKAIQSIFITGESRVTILVHPEGEIEYVSLSESIIDHIIGLENVSGVSFKLSSSQDSTIYPITLLQIILRVKTPLYDLNQLHEHGNGNFLVGMGMFVAHIFRTAVKGAGSLLNSVGDTFVHLLKGVSNGTAKATLASSDGISKIISTTGNATKEIL